MKHEIKAVKQTNVATEKEMYYLIIGEGETKMIINVGEKTYEKVNQLNTKEILGEGQKTSTEKPKK